MSERIEKLKEIVKELEAELEELEDLDEESQQMVAQQALENALDDLRTALGEKDTESLGSESLVDRLRTAEESFQVTHPTIAGLVMRMINALGQLGI